MPADDATLRQIATQTGGSFHTATSEQELESVYKDIGSQIGYTTEHRDISWRFLLGGLLVTLVAAGVVDALVGPVRVTAGATRSAQACGSSTSLPTELRSSSARCASAARSSG